MDSPDFYVTLIQKKDKIYKRPKSKYVSYNPDHSLYDFHQQILIKFNLPDDHFFAFYFQGQPFEFLDFEWGGEGYFSNPTELLFRSLHHHIVTDPVLSKNPENIEEYITDFMEKHSQNQSASMDISPLKDARAITLEECNFTKGQTFYFVYDFGDTFIFKIEVKDWGPNFNLEDHMSFQINDKPADFEDFVSVLKDIILDKPILSNHASNQIPTTRQSSNGSKKAKKRKKNNSWEKYNQVSHNLNTNVFTTYPDQFISEIKRINDDEFTLQLLNEFNYYAKDFSSELLYKCFFSSTAPFDQLCSLFLNQIQLFNSFNDQFFSSFIEFSGSQYISDKTNYGPTVKYLLITTLFLSLDIFDNDSSKTFFSYAGPVFTQENLEDTVNFWNTAAKAINIHDFIVYYLDTCQKNKEKSERIQSYKCFTDTYVYSKISQKAFLYHLFAIIPEIISPLVLFILDQSVLDNMHIRDWTLPIIELVGEHTDLHDFSNLLESLTLNADYSDAASQSIVAITSWLISGNVAYLREVLNTVTTKVQSKIKKILKNPLASKQKIIGKRIKYWSKVSKLSTEFSAPANSNQLAMDLKSIFILEITLKGRKIVRTVAIKGDSSLEDLHLCIQDYFDFDNDHLYGFFLDNEDPRWSNNFYFSSHHEEGPSADKKLIHQCNFFIGMKFLYIFDFGDNWRFQIKVKDIRSRLQEEKEFPYLISEKGKSPTQYTD